jgi:hypothetical protein
LNETAWGEALGVDPGPLLVEASAPGKKPFHATIMVGRERDLKTLVIPLLQAEPPPPRAATLPDEGKPQRWVAYGAGALGLVAIGVGGFFGLRAIDRHKTAEQLCPNLDRCDPRAFQLSEQAATDGRLATYFVTGGALFLGAGVVLFVTAPSERTAPAASVRVQSVF